MRTPTKTQKSIRNGRNHLHATPSKISDTTRERIPTRVGLHQNHDRWETKDRQNGRWGQDSQPWFDAYIETQTQNQQTDRVWLAPHPRKPNDRNSNLRVDALECIGQPEIISRLRADAQPDAFIVLGCRRGSVFLIGVAKRASATHVQNPKRGASNSMSRCIKCKSQQIILRTNRIGKSM